MFSWTRPLIENGSNSLNANLTTFANLREYGANRRISNDEPSGQATFATFEPLAEAST